MIHETTLQDCLEPAAPPTRVLTLGALDDTRHVRYSPLPGRPEPEQEGGES